MAKNIEPKLLKKLSLGQWSEKPAELPSIDKRTSEKKPESANLRIMEPKQLLLSMADLGPVRAGMQEMSKKIRQRQIQRVVSGAVASYLPPRPNKSAKVGQRIVDALNKGPDHK